MHQTDETIGYGLTDWTGGDHPTGFWLWNLGPVEFLFWLWQHLWTVLFWLWRLLWEELFWLWQVICTASRVAWLSLPESAQFRLACFALDTTGLILKTGRILGLCATAVLTVRWDPAGVSHTIIRLPGYRTDAEPYHGFTISTAPSERDRRFVAWFYRWHDAPDAADWRLCLRLCGRVAPPTRFTLQLHDPGRTPLDERILVNISNVVTWGTTGEGNRALTYIPSQASGQTNRKISGDVVLGGHCPSQFLKDLGLEGKAR